MCQKMYLEEVLTHVSARAFKDATYTVAKMRIA